MRGCGWDSWWTGAPLFAAGGRRLFHTAPCTRPTLRLRRWGRQCRGPRSAPRLSTRCRRSARSRGRAATTPATRSFAESARTAAWPAAALGRQLGRSHSADLILALPSGSGQCDLPRKNFCQHKNPFDIEKLRLQVFKTASITRKIFSKAILHQAPKNCFFSFFFYPQHINL